MCKKCQCATSSPIVLTAADRAMPGFQALDTFQGEVKCILEQLAKCELDVGGAVSEIRIECDLLLGRLGYEYPV